MHNRHKDSNMHHKHKCSNFNTTHLHFTQNLSHIIHNIHTKFERFRFWKTQRTFTTFRICKQMISYLERKLKLCKVRKINEHWYYIRTWTMNVMSSCISKFHTIAIYDIPIFYVSTFKNSWTYSITINCNKKEIQVHAYLQQQKYLDTSPLCPS